MDIFSDTKNKKIKVTDTTIYSTKNNVTAFANIFAHPKCYYNDSISLFPDVFKWHKR